MQARRGCWQRKPTIPFCVSLLQECHQVTVPKIMRQAAARMDTRAPQQHQPRQTIQAASCTRLLRHHPTAAAAAAATALLLVDATATPSCAVMCSSIVAQTPWLQRCKAQPVLRHPQFIAPRFFPSGH